MDEDFVVSMRNKGEMTHPSLCINDDDDDDDDGFVLLPLKGSGVGEWRPTSARILTKKKLQFEQINSLKEKKI